MEFWWTTSKYGLMENVKELFRREQVQKIFGKKRFHTPHVDKNKSNEFVRFEMGDISFGIHELLF